MQSHPDWGKQSEISQSPGLRFANLRDLGQVSLPRGLATIKDPRAKLRIHYLDQRHFASGIGESHTKSVWKIQRLDGEFIAFESLVIHRPLRV
jgi:hypothetical protein